MLRTFRRRSLLTLTALAACAALGAVAYANHSWGSYHWARTSNPFTLKLGDNVSAVWDPILRTTSADWSKSTVLDTVIVPGGTGGQKRCPATTGRVEVCNDTYGNNGWLGIAQIWASGNHITAAIVKLNDSYFNTARYNTTAWRNLVSCQEVGHAFGLDHQDENFSNANLGTCMDYTNDPSTNQHPNTHDYNQLSVIYGHFDGSTTIGSSVPPSAMNRDLSAPGEWGQRVKGSREQGNEMYERDFGNGHKVFTFVTWALEARGGHIGNGGHDEHE